MNRLALIALLLALVAPASATPPRAAAAPAAPTLKWAYAGCFASWCQTG